MLSSRVLLRLTRRTTPTTASPRPPLLSRVYSTSSPAASSASSADVAAGGQAPGASASKGVARAGRKGNKGVKLSGVRGVPDWFEPMTSVYSHVETVFRSVTQRFGFEEVRAPVLEDKRLFDRGMGVQSAIVHEEMFHFPYSSAAAAAAGGKQSKAKQQRVALRPEGTAGVLRAMLSQGKGGRDAQPLRAAYAGPMFRRERPQAGRYRQFQQVGVEAVGFASSVAEAEIVSAACMFLRELGLEEHVELQVNTIGDRESQEAYTQVLMEYCQTHYKELSKVSQRRVDAGNVLRVLDSKEERDLPLVAEAPDIFAHLNDASRLHWAAVCDHLSCLDIPFQVNKLLVRGLDYYTHTVFEFVERGSTTRQSTVVAGGRYDGLMENIGGPPMPSAGWAAGLERLALLINKHAASFEPGSDSDEVVVESAPAAAELPLRTRRTHRRSNVVLPPPRLAPDVLIVPWTIKEQDWARTDLGRACLTLADTLRDGGLRAAVPHSGALNKIMARVGDIGCQFVTVVGPDELASGEVELKNTQTREKTKVPFASMGSWVVRQYQQQPWRRRSEPLPDVAELFVADSSVFAE